MGVSGELGAFFAIDSVRERLKADLLSVGKSPAISGQFVADSRLVKPGDVFVAMRGQNDDGHRYIGDAVARGAGAVLLERAQAAGRLAGVDVSGATVLAVDDPELAASSLAADWLGIVSPKVVGVTGSVGKTTTREFLSAMIRGSLVSHAAIKSYNTLIGCAMTILGMPAGTGVLLLELGANHAGEIRELVERFPVTHGIITDVAPAHLEGFGSIEGVLSAKMEICESRALQVMSYNNDNSALSGEIREWAASRAGVKTIGVGLMPADATIKEIEQSISPDGTAKLSFAIDINGSEHRCEAGVFGKQHARNIAYAFAIALELGISADIARNRVKTLASLAGRGKISILRGNGLLVDESYNANPASVSHALKNVLEAKIPGGLRRIAILGGMRELGEETGKWHSVVMNRASLFDEVYLIGSEWDSIKTTHGAIRGRFASAEDFIDDVGCAGFKDALVLIKGSRYYELEKTIACLADGI